MFRRDLRDLERRRIFAVETAGGAAIARVDCVLHDGAWHLDVEMLPAFRQRGLEVPIRERAIGALREDLAGALALGATDPAAPRNGAALRIALCSDRSSWINCWLPSLARGWIDAGHRVDWAHDAAQLPAADLCFLLSYGRIVTGEQLARNRHNLVVHESDLPHGRGWSPLTWQVLEGRQVIPVTLFEADREVDAGVIYLQEEVVLRGDELVDELRQRQVESTFSLCRRFVAEYPAIVARGRPQHGVASHYRRRGPADARLDPDAPLREQLDLLRVSDNKRYPAWFESRGTRYRLLVERADEGRPVEAP